MGQGAGEADDKGQPQLCAAMGAGARLGEKNKYFGHGLLPRLAVLLVLNQPTSVVGFAMSPVCVIRPRD